MNNIKKKKLNSNYNSTVALITRVRGSFAIPRKNIQEKINIKRK